MPASRETAICVALTDDLGYARIIGRGCIHVSLPLKEFILNLTQKNPPRSLVLDFADCRTLDSTFMGMLAGTARTYNELPDQQLLLINMGSQLSNVLTRHGLQFVLEWHAPNEEPESAQALLDQIPDCEIEQDKNPSVEDIVTHMLESHENLADLNVKNAIEFKDVITYLREDLERQRRENDSEDEYGNAEGR